MAGRSCRSRKNITVVSVLFLVLAAILGPTPSSAATDWWTPTARPAPDAQINVTGAPFTGTNSAGEVRGSSTPTTTSSPTRPSAGG